MVINSQCSTKLEGAGISLPRTLHPQTPVRLLSSVVFSSTDTWKHTFSHDTGCDSVFLQYRIRTIPKTNEKSALLQRNIQKYFTWDKYPCIQQLVTSVEDIEYYKCQWGEKNDMYLLYILAVYNIFRGGSPSFQAITHTYTDKKWGVL